jgi:hypothetical protein
MQFRWVMFKGPQFDLPGQSLGSGGFGDITGATFERRIMQLGLNL